ncbi:MAG: site-specific integrase, partial [Spirochaetia bacterium]
MRKRTATTTTRTPPTRPAPAAPTKRRTAKVPDEYLSYLKSVRNLSTHTLESYTKDLLKYEAFLEARGIPALKA